MSAGVRGARVCPAAALWHCWSALSLTLAFSGCTPGGSRLDAATPIGVGQFRRPPGMAIGTGATSAVAPKATAHTPVDPLEPAPAEVTAPPTPDVIPSGGVQPAATVAPIPCTGCLELNVDVDDINQRDEFVFTTDGAPVTKVVWTLRVNFNSDQLAVQPFADNERGKYTSLHVNTFPLGQPVEIEQLVTGKPHAIGLVVGSSGAWTGNQTMSVFVDSVSVEGTHGFTKTFATDAEGLAPRTNVRRPKVVLHPEK